jgi:GTP-binding protein
VADALRAIRFAEVVVILVDSTIPLEKQDLSILSLVEREGRGLVIGLNKWDLVENRTELLEKLHEEAEHLLSNVKGVALVPVSGLTGEGADGLLKACMDAEAVWNNRIPTGQLNRWFEQVLERHPPPAVAGRRIKMRYVTQIKARPPHFVVFGNQLDRMPDSYVRYLVNSLRDTFELNGVPVRVSMRTSENPYGRKRD